MEPAKTYMDEPCCRARARTLGYVNAGAVTAEHKFTVSCIKRLGTGSFFAYMAASLGVPKTPW